MPPAALAARMARELKRLERSPPPGISAWPAAGSISQLEAQLQGPPDSPYEAGLFRLRVAVPERYPFEPPKVTFVTRVYHPNIDAQGRICLDYLNMPPKGSWGPAMDLCKVLLAVRQLLAEPNPADPLVPEIAEEYVAQPLVFRAKAQQHVAQHATPGGQAGGQWQQQAEQQQWLEQQQGGQQHQQAGQQHQQQAEQQRRLEQQQQREQQQREQQQQQPSAPDAPAGPIGAAELAAGGGAGDAVGEQQLPACSGG